MGLGLAAADGAGFAALRLRVNVIRVVSDVAAFSPLLFAINRL
jgi:hypothetical protein